MRLGTQLPCGEGRVRAGRQWLSDAQFSWWAV